MDMGPLGTLFKQMDLKPLVSRSFGEMSTNFKEYIELAVNCEAEHLDKTMTASTVEAVRATLRRWYKSHLSAAN
jgi:hypothetical protein